MFGFAWKSLWLFVARVHASRIYFGVPRCGRPMSGQFFISAPRICALSREHGGGCAE
jgi:hypothetical protein